MNAPDAILEFIGAMEAAGIRAVDPIAQRLGSGELIRFRCEGDGKGRQNGWAKIYLDEHPAGAFGNYRMGIDEKWKSGAGSTLSDEERGRLRKEWEQARQRRAEERQRSEDEAAREANDIWRSAPTVSFLHPYVAKKRLDPEPLRQQADKLLIPMFDGDGRLWNLQRIAPDGTKRFLRGGRTSGLFCIIGRFTRRGERICIGEGYATMHAVHRAVGHPCIAAFSAKNMLAVARLWNAARPDLDYIICADDDSHLDRNVGRDAAQAAAEAIGARLAMPLGRAA